MSVSLGDVIAVLIAVITSGVAWGTLRQRISNVEARVSTLEGEYGKMQAMAERLVRVETLLSTQNESIRDLANSLRWLRPASFPPEHPEDAGGNGGHRR